nr:probable serine/threonine-protein kinase BSK3 [Aegilops tauschii subsp. strangulata]
MLLCNQTSLPPKLPFQYLKMITNNFSDEHALGSGGSGVVYKGRMSNGEFVAVKKLQVSLPSFQKQFENEVYRLMYLNHPNIVRLRGYCYETQNICVEHNGNFVFAEMSERLLCLQYYANGSLADESSGLEWDTRYNIIVEICYGLKYLHEGKDKPVLHMDLKPANILLDNAMKPKITDFGLSRLLDQQQTISTSSRDGTLGYMALEYLHGGTVTAKSDILSLGVIILEVITGHKDYPDVTRTSSERFVELTLDKWRSRNPLNKSPGYIPKIRRCIEIGLACVNPERKGRPSTGELIKLLQGRMTLDELSAASRMEATCFPADLTAIHEILEREGYKEDEGVASELSFQMWTDQMQETITHRKKGDDAFQAGDFQAALDNFTEFIDTGILVSPGVVNEGLAAGNDASNAIATSEVGGSAAVVTGGGTIPPASPTRSTSPSAQAAASSLWRSSCIQKLYDGPRVGSVERAAKRKAAGSSSDGGARRRPRTSSATRKKKAKLQHVSELLGLLLQKTPMPLTRGKVKQIARCCDLNVDAILEAVSQSSSSSPKTRHG